MRPRLPTDVAKAAVVKRDEAKAALDANTAAIQTAEAVVASDEAAKAGVVASLPGLANAIVPLAATSRARWLPRMPRMGNCRSQSSSRPGPNHLGTARRT